jgi:hypothetical protein
MSVFRQYLCIKKAYQTHLYSALPFLCISPCVRSDKDRVSLLLEAVAGTDNGAVADLGGGIVAGFCICGQIEVV